MDVLIGSDGLVKDVSVIETDHSALEEPAIAAVLQWEFRPATDEFGRPREERRVIPLEFLYRPRTPE